MFSTLLVSYTAILILEMIGSTVHTETDPSVITIMQLNNYVLNGSPN